jgi:phosphoribosyl 1,2-cyclic phosphodiesterase
VRGSTPCHGDDIRRYGGNTSCVSLAFPGQRPIMFDLGTGARYFGATQPHDGTFNAVCLLSHLHWDHIQGLPFFTPMLRQGSQLDLYAPFQEDGRSIAEVFFSTVCAPLFPVGIDQFAGTFRFLDLADDDFQIDDMRITARLIPHVGPTLGYRVEWNGISIVYMSDHQQPFDGGFSASDNALELAQGADLLIHDSQYTADEFSLKYNWGHCTMDYAVWFAAAAGVKRLALFHHDPGRNDDAIDRIADCAVLAGRLAGVEVFTAMEGVTISL